MIQYLQKEIATLKSAQQIEQASWIHEKQQLLNQNHELKQQLT